MVLEKTLESPLDCKEIQPVHSKGDQSWVFFEGMLLKLKLQYFGHLIRSVDSLEKFLMLGIIGRRRRRGRQRMRWLDGITNSKNMSLSESRSLWWTRRPGVLWFMDSWRIGCDWATELNWTEDLLCIVSCHWQKYQFYFCISNLGLFSFFFYYLIAETGIFVLFLVLEEIL